MPAQRLPRSSALRLHPRSWVPWLLLAAGLLVTALVASWAHTQAQFRLRRHFDLLATERVQALQQRLHDLEHLLMSSRAAAQAAPDAPQRLLRAQAAALLPQHAAPGLVALGWLQPDADGLRVLDWDSGARATDTRPGGLLALLPPGARLTLDLVRTTERPHLSPPLPGSEPPLRLLSMPLRGGEAGAPLLAIAVQLDRLLPSAPAGDAEMLRLRWGLTPADSPASDGGLRRHHRLLLTDADLLLEVQATPALLALQERASSVMLALAGAALSLLLAQAARRERPRPAAPPPPLPAPQPLAAPEPPTSASPPAALPPPDVATLLQSLPLAAFITREPDAAPIRNAALDALLRRVGHGEPAQAATVLAQAGALFAPLDEAASRLPQPLCLRNASGAALHFLVHRSAHPTAPGQAQGWLHVLVDISELKQAQQAVEEARYAAEAGNRAKSADLRTLGQALRPPLSALVAASERLLDGDPLAGEPQAAQRIASSARGLLALTDGLIDVARLEAGEQRLHTAPFEPAALLRQVCDSLTPDAVQHGVLLVADIDPAFPAWWLGDGPRWRRLLEHLLAHALQQHSVRAGQRRCLTLTLALRHGQIGLSLQSGSLERRTDSLDLRLVDRLVRQMRGRLQTHEAADGSRRLSVELPLPSTFAPDIGGDASATVPDPAHITPPSAALWIEPVLLRLVPRLGAWLQDAGAVVRVSSDATDLQLLLAPVGSEPPASPLARRQLCIGIGGARPQVGASGRMHLGSLRRETLLAAISAALAAPDDALPATPARAEPLASGTVPRPTVLVAEDDAINQRVIAKQLALLGYPFELASDGEEALARWRETRHRLVLSDLHMPRLDGLGLVRALRAEEERSDDARRTRVLAVTANALRGEDRKALAAGFDAYLIKPIALQTLGDALAQWTALTAHPASPETAAGPAEAFLDADALTRLVGDDPKLAHELRRSFRDVLDAQADELIQAMRADDRAQLAALAHKLKSSAASVGATALARLCARLEQLRSGDDSAWLSTQHAQFARVVAATAAALDSSLVDAPFARPPSLPSGTPTKGPSDELHDPPGL